MKIKVNRDQWLNEVEADMRRITRVSRFHGIFEDYTPMAPCNRFETEDVDVETLLEYVKKGYAIKINC